MKTKTLHTMLLAGIVFLAACKGTSEYKALNNADTVSLRADSSSGVKLVKTGSINFKVKNVDRASETISALTTKYGGMVMHHNVRSDVEQTKDFHLSNDSMMRVSSIRTAADLTVKIPSVKLEEFMNEVSHLSLYVTERKMDIEDKSFDYLADQLKLQNRNQFIAQQKKGKVVVKSPSAVLDLKDDMVDQQVNNLRINDAVKYSIIDLHCFQSNYINKEIIANDDPAAYQISYLNRIGTALQNGVLIFGDLMVTLANLWVLLLIAALGWFGFRYYKRKHAKPILNNI
ncbi:DUF4349 domain-containing protein [Mucilaginibacter agri]|uniref:DUF4349 domain-containing protein n=1 Tax=Mucilaginibacter agri TaxID=2695265 RepID=A0A965ZJ12_9SPHI|nr:DUF4349 domain-containing protein [Mucilaginibacter agri]NCD71555.1 DUF4349 domain-containing protein [Mucilaginibacter agri]